MEITFCLMTCGEDTEQECLQSIEKYRDKFVFQEVRNIAPQTIALNKMIDQCTTDYLVPLDSDFILYDGFWERIVSTINKYKNDLTWHSILFPLWEDITRKKVKALKVFRTKIVKAFPYPHERHPDAFHYTLLKEKGFRLIELMDEPPIARHAFRGKERCYFKYKDWLLCLRRVVHNKELVRREVIEYFNMFEKFYNETRNEDYLYCIAGLYDGWTNVEDLGTSKNAFDNNMRIKISEVPRIKRKIFKQLLI